MPKLKAEQLADRARRRPSTKAADKGGFKVPDLTGIEKGRASAKKREKKQHICGAKKRNGGKCMKQPGWGTVHPGIGKCRLHGGSVPTHVRSAAKEEYRILLGKPVETTPEDALISCIQIRTGEVQWLSDRMAELDQESWTEKTMLGTQFHLYARERQAAMRDVARFSQMAIAMNIEERRVRLAETYGEMLANLLRGILDELMPHLDKKGRDAAPIIIRRHLIALDGGVSKEPLALPEKGVA